MRDDRAMRPGRTRRIDAALAELRRLTAARDREAAAGRGRDGRARAVPKRRTTASRP